MTATQTKQLRKLIGPRTAKRTKYAKARVKAGLTVRAMVKLGFGMETISKADSGHLPENPHIRAAYLKAIGLGDVVKP